MRKKTFSKAIAKRITGKCIFCGEDDYRLLDVHRIIPGSENGTYCQRSTVVCCALCHRKTHAERIVIEGKYFTTGGRWIVYYKEDGVEKTVLTQY